MPAEVKPSRTYNLAKFGILAELVLALIISIIAIWSPEAMVDSAQVFLFIAGGIATSSGLGAGAMSYRDVASGGKTTSQFDPAEFGPPDEGSGVGQ